MTERPRDKPAQKPPLRQDRTEREAAALRANLLKRKEQARSREAAAKLKDAD
jgi:hypothetical protein